MSDQELLDFSDITAIEVPVKIGNQDYILREASSEVAARWQNCLFANATVNADGKTAMIGKVADAEPLLVQGCLFKVVGRDEETGSIDLQPVSEAFVKNLPNRVASKLYEKAMEISGLSKSASNPEAIRKQIDKLQKKLAEIEGDDQQQGN